jgi:xanthine dehydrogenase accessory factor
VTPALPWLEALAAFQARGERCVLVTVAELKGSAPRGAGTKFVVTADQQVGSIGGGHLEHKATEMARAMIDGRASEAKLETFALGPALGQCCGGKVTILLEPFAPTDFSVALFGAGHVGKEVVQVLAGTGATIRWIDSRPDQFPATDLPDLTALVSEYPADEVKDLPPGAYALVMTHSHDLDLQIIEALFRRGDCRYIGLIGSATKRRNFETRLERKGFSPAQIASLRCPIGIEGIDGKEPRTIAIAVAAELMRLRDAARTAATTGNARPAITPA